MTRDTDPDSFHLRRIRAVLFDAGHTLVFPDHGVYGEVAREAGAARTGPRDVLAAELAARARFEELLRDGEKPRGPWDSFYWETFYGTLFGHLGVAEEKRRWAAEEIARRNGEGIGLWNRPDPGARATLAALAGAGYVLGVVSNSDGRVERILEALDLSRHLSFVLDSHVVGVSKPDPRIFRLGLERAGTEPAETLFVGDYVEVDVKGARAVGMMPVLFDPAGAYAGADPGCRVIGRLEELPELLPGRVGCGGAGPT